MHFYSILPCRDLLGVVENVQVGLCLYKGRQEDVAEGCSKLSAIKEVEIKFSQGINSIEDEGQNQFTARIFLVSILDCLILCTTSTGPLLLSMGNLAFLALFGLVFDYLGKDPSNCLTLTSRSKWQS